MSWIGGAATFLANARWMWFSLSENCTHRAKTCGLATVVLPGKETPAGGVCSFPNSGLGRGGGPFRAPSFLAGPFTLALPAG